MDGNSREEPNGWEFEGGDPQMVFWEAHPMDGNLDGGDNQVVIQGRNLLDGKWSTPSDSLIKILWRYSNSLAAREFANGSKNVIQGCEDKYPEMQSNAIDFAKLSYVCYIQHGKKIGGWGDIQKMTSKPEQE